MFHVNVAWAEWKCFWVAMKICYWWGLTAISSRQLWRTLQCCRIGGDLPTSECFFRQPNFSSATLLLSTWKVVYRTLTPMEGNQTCMVYIYTIHVCLPNTFCKWVRLLILQCGTTIYLEYSTINPTFERTATPACQRLDKFLFSFIYEIYILQWKLRSGTNIIILKGQVKCMCSFCCKKSK